MGDKDILSNIFAVQGELQEIVRQLLKMLALEHKHSVNHTYNPNVALSNILSTAFRTANATDVLRTFKTNYDSIYDRSASPPIVKPSIDIDSLDSSFMFDILESIDGFPTCSNVSKQKSKSNACSSSTHVGRCCSGCDHSCSFCNQVNCKKSCPGFGQDHPCQSCQEEKPFCKRNMIICCAKCQLCRHCGKQVAESNQCSVLKLCIGVNVAHFLRNLFGHLTEQVCKDFIDGKRTLKGFQSKTWDDFTKEIIAATGKILDFMTNQSNFQIQSCLSVDESEKNLRRVQTILENDSAYVKENFLGSICKGVKDLENEKSNELQELIKENYSQLLEIKKGVCVIREDQHAMKEELREGQHAMKEELQKGQHAIMKKLEDVQVSHNQQTNSSAIREVSQSLKNWYMKKYSKVNHGAAFTSSNSSSTFVPHNEIFVDVTLVDNDMSNGEKEHFNLESLLAESGEYIVLNGVPGVGKTTLMKTLVCKWAKGELFNGQNGNPKYDFVFLLFCRNFHKYKGKPNVIEDYIANEYLQVFDMLSIKDLRQNKSNVLLIIEGFDESASYEEFQRMPDDLKDVSDHCRAMHELLNPENTALPFHRIVTTRPLSRTLVKRFNKAVRMKSVEILGFSRKQIQEYIANHFSNSPEKIETVKRKLSENPQLLQLATRPVFCWAFCSLFKEDPMYEIPATITSIYASIILIFLRNHCTRRTSEPLKDLLSLQEVRTTLLALTEIAYMSLVKGNIAFETQELKASTISFKQVVKESGLIETIEGGDLKEHRFQFTHLSIHEYLAAFYIYLNNLYLTETYFNDNGVILSLPSSLLFLSGFIGGQLEGSLSHIFTKIFSSVKGKENTRIKDCTALLQSLKNDERTHLYYEMLFEFQNPIASLPFTAVLMLPPALNSYRIMCIKYLFRYIQNYNDNKLPFGVLQLDQLNVKEEIVSMIRPYLKQLHQFLLMQCSPGFVKSVSSVLPHIPVISLPHCNVTQDDWKSFASETMQAYCNDSIQITSNFRVADFGFYYNDSAFYYNHDMIVPKCVYKVLPLFQYAEMQFDINRLNILTCDRPFQSKLQSLNVILKGLEHFRELAKHLPKLPNLKTIEVHLIRECSKCKTYVPTAKTPVMITETEVEVEYLLKREFCGFCWKDISMVCQQACAKQRDGSSRWECMQDVNPYFLFAQSMIHHHIFKFTRK